MKTNDILWVVLVALIVTRMRVMAREGENGKGGVGGSDWFRDYMQARDLAEQEEDGLGSEVEEIDEGEGI
jgi:hypothetical protein